MYDARKPPSAQENLTPSHTESPPRWNAGKKQGEEDALDQHRPEPHGDDRLRAHDGDRRVVGGEDGEMGRALDAERDYHVGEDGQTDGGRLAGFHGGLSGAFIMQVS